jgi:hypothetical protein
MILALFVWMRVVVVCPVRTGDRSFQSGCAGRVPIERMRMSISEDRTL